MSFRGRMGINRGRGGRFGRGGGRANRSSNISWPPAKVIEAGTLSHTCEGEAIIKLTTDKIPMFNAPIYIENKTQIGKVEEIFGLTANSLFTVKMLPGVKAESYSEGDKFYIEPHKLMQKERFLEPEENNPKPIQRATRGGGRDMRGRGRGGRRGGFQFSKGRGRGFQKSGGIFKKRVKM